MIACLYHTLFYPMELDGSHGFLCRIALRMRFFFEETPIAMHTHTQNKDLRRDRVDPHL